MRANSLLSRFWIYQAERFPLLSYAVLVAALVLGGLGYAAAARSAGAPDIAGVAAAWLTVLGVFFQLRVADEFKDFETDARYRPYRPVPRGVIARRELAWLAVGVGLVQLGVNLWLDLGLLLPLLAVWGYLLLMAREFFVHAWLTARPLFYMLSHMGIMALLFVYIAAVDTLPAASTWPAGWRWFLLAGYANGIVFEIGRKVRAPEDEETGVETYSVLWGARGAAAGWWGALAAAGLGLTLAAWAVGAGMGIGMLAVGLLGVGLVVAIRYAAQPQRGRAKWIDRFSALWVLLLYGALALLPWL